MRGYPGNKSTYIILLRIELHPTIYIYDSIYSITQLTSHLVPLRQTNPLLFRYPEQTVPGGEAGHDRRPLQSWLVQGSISLGSFSSLSSLKSLQRQIADRGNGWVSFQRGASSCLIIQGHIEQINKTTLMYGQVENMCLEVVVAVGYTATHTHPYTQTITITNTHTSKGSDAVCYLSSQIWH